MPTITDKQILQVHNIMETLLEASEHFSVLIKNKEVSQSVFIFSSIVEGFGAISNTIATTDINEFTEQRDKTEKLLLLIAQHLEKANFVKIMEILQFSFLPQLKKLYHVTAEKVGDKQKNKTFTIGVFASRRNPLNFYTDDRVNALVQESDKQNVKLLFLTSNDVDFDKKVITADVWQEGKWKRVTAPFPDVINNAGVGKRTHTERKLRRQIPFTSFHVGNKFTLPKRIIQHRRYAELLVPFRVCQNEAVIYNFLKDNKKVVFKALRGNRGEYIYFVTKKGNRYAVLEHKKERIFNKDSFNQWMQTTILNEKGSYIIQRYIHTRTKIGEPYHIRAHVQKDGEGKWRLTHIYPRIGNKKSNLSNISTDGRIEDLHTFLKKEYGDLGEKYEDDILKLSIDLAWHLDKLHGFSLDELGIDFAIDDYGRYWMHEANNGPQTAYHEEKRAVNTIAYALYIAKKGLVHTDSNRRTGVKGQFSAKTTNIPFFDPDNRPCIGMLEGKNMNDKLTIASTLVAKEENMTFYSFRPEDIDFDEMLIKGRFYEKGKWVSKVVEYPDVIYDQLKQRGKKNAQMIYGELEAVPFTNEWPGQINQRSELYNKLQSSGELADYLPPYRTVTKTGEIARFIKKYGKALFKPDITAFSNSGIYIEQNANGEYIVTKETSKTVSREFAFTNLFKRQLKEGKFIIQKDFGFKASNEHSFEIRVDLMKDKKNNWSLTSIYASSIKQIEDNSFKFYRENLNEFLGTHYGVDDATSIEEQVESLSLETVIIIEEVIEYTIGEVSLIWGRDCNGHLKLIDVNPNGPEMIYNITKTAKDMISYAGYLAVLNEDLSSI